MSDEADPPRKFYGLKPREFEVVNPRTNEPAPTGQTQQPTDVRDLFQLATSDKRHGEPLPPSGENDVQRMLREEVERANAAGLNDLAPRPKRRSRRLWQYVGCLIAVNAFFVGAALLQPGVIVFAGAGVVLFTVGFTWVMWVVMDDY